MKAKSRLVIVQSLLVLLQDMNEGLLLPTPVHAVAHPPELIQTHMFRTLIKKNPLKQLLNETQEKTIQVYVPFSFGTLLVTNMNPSVCELSPDLKFGHR
jgi:hypothetical protein